MADEEKSLKFNSENRVRQTIIGIQQIIYKTILKPPEWLEGLQSPFKWGLHIRGIELVRWNIPGKLCDYDNQGAFYGFERLAFLLAMIFVKKCRSEEDKMLEKESGSDESEDENDSQEEESVDEYEPEKCYAMCKETVDQMAATEGDIMYNRIGPALQHVLQATRAHMLFFNGNHAESQELARNIQPLEEMAEECQAGFEGLRAKVVMSMVQNYTIVLPYLHKAMELDPNFGYWPYLIGKVLRRARREFDEGLIEEELEFFEKAVSLERNPKFLVFLGQAYQETAITLFHSRGPTGSLDHLYQKAVELYSECWMLKNDSAAISRRVGNGMSKMRSEHINKTVAKEALLKAIELSPNECTHLSLGKFYYLHEMNDEKALEHFEKFHPSDFGTSEIIRLNLIKDPNYDPYDVLQPWLKLEENAVKQYRAFCDAAWYYLVFNRNLELAAKYIWRVIVIDNRSIRAKRALEYQSYAFCVEGPVNLLEVLVNEILLLKEKNECLPLEVRKDMKLLEDILQKLFQKYPDLCNINPRPNLVGDLKRKVERYIAIRRRRRYGSGQRRSEPSRGQEEPVNWRNNRPNDSTQESNEQQPYRQQEGYGNRQWNNQWQSPSSSGNNGRSDMRNSFGVRDDEGRSRGYNRDDRRRNSESSREDTSNQNEANNRFNNNRGRTDRQYNGYSNNRYDVTVTDWRRENRKQ